MTIQAIFFDFDDTLQDLASAYDVAANAVLAPVMAEHGLDNTTMRAIMDQCWLPVWQGFLDRTLTESQMYPVWFGGVLTELGASRWDAQVLAHQYHILFDRALSLFSDVTPALDMLQSRLPEIATAILTNGPQSRQKDRIRALNLEERIPLWVISEEIGVSKPDRAFFQHALRLLDVRPEAAVMIGNSPESDISGAHNAQLRTIWLNRSLKAWPMDTLRPDAEATNLIEAVEIIAAWH